MKSPGSLVSFAAALFLALGAWVQAKDADGVAASYPDLQFDTTRYDFGVVKQDDPVKHQFNFKNAGRGELVLQSIKTTCGCTAATASACSAAISAGD